jgi:hypothetical protein
MEKRSMILLTIQLLIICIINMELFNALPNQKSSTVWTSNASRSKDAKAKEMESKR